MGSEHESPNLRSFVSRHPSLAAGCLIMVFTFAVYANSLGNQFTNWDDPGLVLDNPSLRSLAPQNVLDIFTPRAGATYQPVRVLSYAIDYHLWKLNPLGYHLGNTLLHGLSALLLYGIFLRLLRGDEEGDRESAQVVSLTSALIFVVHPVNVEAVTWIASRKYGLLGLFCCLSLYLYLKSANGTKRHMGYYSLSVVAYILALLASPLSVTLPGLLWLCDYYREKKLTLFSIIRKNYLYYLPYGVLAIAQFITLRQVLSGGPEPAIKSHFLNNPAYTLLTMLRVLFDYIKNLILPLWLNNRYIDRFSINIFEYKIIVTLIVLLLVGVRLFRCPRSNHRLMALCLGWFFLTLSPALNILPISTTMADRYLYVPAIGLFLGFSFWLYKSVRLRFAHRFNMVTYVSIVSLVLLAFSYLTIQRNRVWANSQTLWEDSLRQAPNSYLAHLNLGDVFHQQGKLDEAITHYLEALRLDPDGHKAHNGLGVALAARGDFVKALEHYDRALEIKPGYAEALSNRGITLAALGKYSEAFDCCSAALRLRPDWPEGHANIGNILAAQGNFSKAVEHYSEGLRLMPYSAQLHNNLAVVLARQGRLEGARDHYLEALRLEPTSPQIHNNLGVTLAGLGDLEGAVKHYLRALELAPHYVQVENNLGDVLARLGKLEEAKAHLSRALEMDPAYAEAHNNLGVVLAQQGKLDEAIAHFGAALRLQPNYENARGNLELALQELRQSSPHTGRSP